MNLSMRRPFGRLASTVLAAGLSVGLLAGCGSTSGGAAAGSSAPTSSTSTSSSSATSATSAAASPSASGSAAAASGFPVTVKDAGGSITLTHRPTRIVSLSPTGTEMLFSIGAGSQVVAVDSDSNYPPQAPHTALSAFKPNAEALAQYRPDLVVLSNDLNGIVAALGKLKVPVLMQPAAATINDTYAEISALGQATGHVQQAGQEVAQMRHDIAGIIAKTPKPAHPLTYYYELDNTYYSLTSKTFVGNLLRPLGLVSIADKADKTGSGYPQLSAEYIVTSKPDLILLADTKCCGQTAAKVAHRPGWNAIPAVRDGGIVPLDDDIASRWGPRVVDLLRTVAAAVSTRVNG